MFISRTDGRMTTTLRIHPWRVLALAVILPWPAAVVLSMGVHMVGRVIDAPEVPAGEVLGSLLIGLTLLAVGGGLVYATMALGRQAVRQIARGIRTFFS
jgi:hypothetical protein